MGDHVIGKTDELSEGDRLLVEVEGREIGVFCIDDDYRAYVNWCAHQGGPVCEGGLSGKQEADFDDESLEMNLEWSREDEILACPWHDWEFDLENGKHVSRPDIELLSYPVRVEDGEIIISV